MSVVSVAIAPSRVCTFTQNGWTIVLDDAFLQTILTSRRAKLPNETGGVLLGSIDLERRVIFVVDTIPSPPDSEEWPTLYIRGCKGLFTKARQISAITGEEVQYIGEWHSHPDGYDCRPSAADVEVFGWLTAHLDKDGLPALMMIAGEGGVVATFVGRMVAGELPPDDDRSDAGA
jgi:proteasome lid subunit RPN8/RPN11